MWQVCSKIQFGPPGFWQIILVTYTIREPSALLGPWQNFMVNNMLIDSIIAQLSTSRNLMVNSVVRNSQLSYLDTCISLSHY